MYTFLFLSGPSGLSCVSNELRKSLQALPEINNKRFFFKGLVVCKLENTARQISRNAPKKKVKLKILIVNSTLSRIIVSAFLALDWSEMAISQTSGSQDDGYQEVWARPGDLNNGCQIDGHVSPSGDNWKVTWRSRCTSRHSCRTGKVRNLKFPR